MEAKLLIDILNRMNISFSTVNKEKEDEDSSWDLLTQESLSGAYSDDEPEYSLDLVQEPNPDYNF
jgi:hypothetical protein